MEQIILHGISATELYNKFDKLEKQLELVLKLVGPANSPDSEIRYLTRKETSIILNISLPTLSDWTKEGKLTSYRIGTRVFYKPEEVNKSLIKVQFKSVKSNYGV